MKAELPRKPTGLNLLEEPRRVILEEGSRAMAIAITELWRVILEWLSLVMTRISTCKVDCVCASDPDFPEKTMRS